MRVRESLSIPLVRSTFPFSRLTRRYEICCRATGGANAGHTIIIQGKAVAFHLVPIGIVQPQAKCIIGNGCVVNIFTLFEEIEALKQENIGVKDRFGNVRCPIVDCTYPIVLISFSISIRSAMVWMKRTVEVWRLEPRNVELVQRTPARWSVSEFAWELSAIGTDSRSSTCVSTTLYSVLSIALS